MVEKYLRELLFDHDCVVLPEFGGFIAHRESADIHPITHKFQPPFKKIAFNEQLKLNDGLLMATIAHRENITQEQAIVLIKEYIAKITDELKKTNTFVIKEIGRFFYNKDNRLEFEPENSVNYLTDSFGLTELFFKPIERNISDMNKIPPRVVRPAVKKRVVENTPKSTENGEVAPKKKSGLRVLLLIIPLLILLFGVGGYFLFMNKDNKAMSSLDPRSWFAKVESVQEEVVATETEEASTVVTTEAEEEIETESEIEPVIDIVEETSATSTTGSASTISAGSGRYYIVVGAFVRETNAIKFQNKLVQKGEAVKLIEPSSSDRFYKVTVADFSDLSEATAKLDQYRSSYGSGVWVMKY
ncbi:MAG TPA: SPOR domain-containing protein [Cytophagaceae bacterium]